MITLTEVEREFWRAAYCSALTNSDWDDPAQTADASVKAYRERLALPYATREALLAEVERLRSEEVIAGAERAQARVDGWPAWKRDFSKAPAADVQHMPAPWTVYVGGWKAPAMWEIPKSWDASALTREQFVDAAQLNGYPDAWASVRSFSPGLHEDDPRRTPVQSGIEVVGGAAAEEPGFFDIELDGCKHPPNHGKSWTDEHNVELDELHARAVEFIAGRLGRTTKSIRAKLRKRAKAEES